LFKKVLLLIQLQHFHHQRQIQNFQKLFPIRHCSLIRICLRRIQTASS